MNIEELQKNTNFLLQNAIENLSVLNSNINSINQSFNLNLSDWISLLSVMLVVIGWRIIYNNARKISTRSETKSIIDDAIKIISDLESITLDYWLSGRKDRKETNVFLLLVTAKLQTLNSKIDILGDRDLVLSKDDLAMFSTYITLDAETVDSMLEEDKRDQMQRFLNCSNQYTENLYKVFQEKYSPVFSSKFLKLSF